MNIIGTGWAVAGSNDQVDLRTVGETRRSALVNWLVAGVGIAVYTYTTDEQIENAWDMMSKKLGTRVIEVQIMEKA